MKTINKVILLGNVTEDLSLHTTRSGQSVVSFGIATERHWAKASGEEKSSTEYHRCVAWSKLADVCAKILEKGAAVYVEGYLQTRTRDDNGVKRYHTEIILTEVILLNKKERYEGSLNYSGHDKLDLQIDGDIMDN